MTRVLRLRGSYGPQLQTLALNKNLEGTDATLKRLYREGSNIRLQPSNTAMKPIVVPAKSVALQGRVIGVLRKY